MGKTEFGIKGILSIYEGKYFFQGLKYSLLICLILMIPLVCFEVITPSVIFEVSNSILSISPGLMGFVLGGYALLVGFAEVKFIAVTRQDDNATLFQKMSAIFSVSLIMLIFLIIYAFCVKTISALSLPFLFEGESVCEAFNALILFLLMLGAIYTLFLTKDLVINVFNFSQIRHYLLNNNNKGASDLN